MRRQRDAHRARRHLVSSGLAARAAGDGPRVPIVAAELPVDGAARDATLASRLNNGDIVPASPAHPLRFVEHDDGPHPYLHVRGGLEALVARSLYYDLAERALAGDDEPPGVWSAGAFFPLMP